MNKFFIDSKCKVEISWENLISDLDSETTFNPYCKTDSFYQVFKAIVKSILLNRNITLLDADLSQDEVKQVTGFASIDPFQETDVLLQTSIASKTDLIELLKKGSDSWRLTLFTSGTTGTPKRITHSFRSLTKNVKLNSRKHSIWGFAYNPTHMAGLQVFLQALLNGNRIVRLFGLSSHEILHQIEQHQITHISATPTFYRLLLPVSGQFSSVKRLTSGGEKFNSTTMDQLHRAFPNAKITNIYASTEAGSIFAASGDHFEIKSELIPLIKIIDNELVLHRSLLAESFSQKDDWYFTGDLVEILSDSPLKFRFKSRKNDLINIGGLNVNPLEVEEVLLQISGVNGAHVFAKKNSVIGNLLCAKVATEYSISESEIRRLLSQKLQEYKIPRMISFVDQLEVTRTGKLKRLAS